MAKTLTVYLAADLKKFTGGLNSAERQVNGFSSSLKNVLGPALIGAGVAAGAFATKLAVDGVKSAIEDEAAVAKLATTLSNLGFDTALQPLEAYIAEMELATGIVDNELRAAFERLVRSTGDVEEAQKALQISVDVSASKGKDLIQVADSLGKAYDGQVTSIQRLGTGISNATILSKDMEAITSELQSLFAGQARSAASTYEGQINRLSVSFENLKESFGAGFLDALGDTNAQTDDLMETMKDLGPLVEALGQAVGEAAEDFLIIGKGVADLANHLQDLNTEGGKTEVWTDTILKFAPVGIGAFGNLADTIEKVNKLEDKLVSGTVLAARAMGNAAGPARSAAAGIDEAGNAADEAGDSAVKAAAKFATLGEAMAAVGGETFNWRREVAGATDEAREFALTLDNQVIDRNYQEWLDSIAESTKNVGGSSSSAAKKTDELTAAQKKLVKVYEAQSEVFSATEQNLKDQVTELERAAGAVRDYASSIQDDLLGGISLEAAYKGQFTKEGELSGISLVEGFNKQIDQAEWFGNVLNAIKAKGADQTLIEEIASLGPGIGGALGQQLLDDGLVPTMSERWSHVQEVTAGLADGLVPEFLRAGVQSGIETVNGLAEQLSQEGARLAKLGKKIAKPVGASFKAQLAQDVADAIAQAQAAGTAARAEAYAKEQARQAALTEQAVAQGIANLVRNADQRNGRDLNPVLA